MPSDSIAFVDTNLLVYTLDPRDEVKRDRANELVDELWTDGRAALSTQVLQEFYSVVRSELREQVTAEQATDAADFFATWPVHENTTHDVLDAIVLHQREQLAFWDALIVVAAQRSGASVVYSEDFGDRSEIEGVRFENPFAEFGAP